MHVCLALFSVVVKFNSVKSLESHFWETKTSAKWSHLTLRAMAAAGFTWCVARRVLACLRLCVCVFGSAETLANPLCASQCPVSEELWPLSSCSLLKPQKKWESFENANETRYAPKLFRRDALLGQSSTYSTLHALAHTHTLSQLHICTHVQLGKTLYYVVQGFLWVSNDLAVSTFLVELKRTGFTSD